MPTLVSKTIKSSGGDYTTLAAWAAANISSGTNLVTADQIQQAVVFDPMTITSGFVINGTITTDATRYIEITADPSTRHVGIYDESKSICIGNNVADLITISGSLTNITDVRISWLQFINKNISAATAKTGVNATCKRLILENCIFKCDTAVTSTATVFGPRLVSVGNPQSSIIRNCIAFGFINVGGTAAGFQTLNATNTTSYLYNCTSYGCNIGFNGPNTSSVIVKNCLAVNCTTSFAGFTGNGASSNNASSGAISIVSSVQPLANRTVQFVDAAGGDFRLASADFGVTAYGRDLSTDSVFPFSTDITGATIVNAWSIGAHCNPHLFTNGVSVITSEIKSTGSANGIGGFNNLVNWYAAMVPTGVVLTTPANPLAAGFNQIQRAVVFTPTLDSTLAISGVTTDAAHYIEITADPSTRHIGAYDESKSIYIGNAATSLITIAAGHYVRISWMQFINKNVAGTTTRTCVANSGIATINNCIFKGDPSADPAADMRGFERISGASCQVVNCIAFGFNTSAATTAAFKITGTGNPPVLIYNCTAYNCTKAFIATTSLRAANCLAVNCTTVFSASGANGYMFNNASSGVTIGGNTINGKINRTVTFINAAAGDFRLHSSDTGATGLGMDMTSDPYYPVTTDITGTAISGNPSIGASFNLDTRGAPTVVINTIKSSGGQYTTLANWAAAQISVDLQINNQISRALVFTPTLSTVLTIAAPSVGGSDEARYFEITADTSTRHIGVWDDTKSKYSVSGGLGCLESDYLAIRVSWMQFMHSNSSNATRQLLRLYGQKIIVENCLFKEGTGMSGTGISATGLFASNFDIGTTKTLFRNCAALNLINSKDGSFKILQSGSIGGQSAIYNCTSYGGDKGFQISGNQIILKNCLSVSNVTYDYPNAPTSSESTNNASSSNVVLTSMGSNAHGNVIPLFVDAANGDLHLQITDTGASGFGANLSADPYFPFNTDIDGDVISAPWSVGIDYNAVAALTRPFYYMLSQGMR